MQKIKKFVVLLCGMYLGIFLDSVVRSIHQTLPEAYMTKWDAFHMLLTFFVFVWIGLILGRAFRDTIL